MIQNQSMSYSDQMYHQGLTDEKGYENSVN